MRKTILFLALCAAVTASAFAAAKDHVREFPSNQGGGAAGAGNVVDHGGDRMTDAKVVFIFWGWSSKAAASDAYINNIITFRDSPNGLLSHVGMLAQYGAGSTGLKGTQSDVFDPKGPGTPQVTDAMVEAKVALECAKMRGGCRTDTIYEVLIPSGWYSDDGTGAQSCGGANLVYCAYHGYGDDVNLSSAFKYSIQPYPSCFGCQGDASWYDYHNQEHFICHETREAMSDPHLNAWYDHQGYEADDKCAWGKKLQFLFQETVPADGRTYAYQMEYSNSAKGCVQK